MDFSLVQLEAFVQVATLGSFSAAARKMGKSQSTISEAIANLEIDLNVCLFERKGHLPILTEEAKELLSYAQRIFNATDLFSKVANQFSDALEPHLTLALTDTFPYQHYTYCLEEISQQFPTLRFESLVAEFDDVMELVGEGRADLGLLPTQRRYESDIAHITTSCQSKFSIFVAASHPLAEQESLTYEILRKHRLLLIQTANPRKEPHPIFELIHPTHTWSGSNYLTLLGMTARGFGWAELPYDVAQMFADKGLVELEVQGWPYNYPIDVIWSRKKGLGKAGSWLLDLISNISEKCP